METLQEYQAGILERVENFPRGGIPEWVEAQVLLHEVDSLARYGYPIEGMNATTTRLWWRPSHPRGMRLKHLLRLRKS